MSHFCWLVIGCVLLHGLRIDKFVVHSSGCSCKSTFSTEHVIANHILVGHVISRSRVADVGQCFNLCVHSSSLCVSFNIGKEEDKRMCELNGRSQGSIAHALEKCPGWVFYQVEETASLQPSYFKDCGCQRYAEPACDCQDGYLGNYCNLKARSCQDYLRFKHSYPSGYYVVFDSNNTLFTVYCDMDYVSMSAWTLVLSYALQYNQEFNSTPFFLDNPLNEYAPNWSVYRLSLSRMRTVRDSSQSWRASCNNTTGDKIDYAVAHFADIDLLTFDGNGCQRFAYINIRGSNCSNCTTWVHQGLHRSRMFLVAARYGETRGCDLIAAPRSSLYEESFGYYTSISRDFRCTSSDESTTQFWFGGPVK